MPDKPPTFVFLKVASNVISIELTSIKLGVSLFSGIIYKWEQEKKIAGKTTKNKS